jgi:uncharacterized membrane protein YfcA
MDGRVALAGLFVGFVIGLTGMGGGALMTPILVLLFGVSPIAAISSDVVASFVLKPFGGTVHLRRGTVDLRLVRWLCLGSVPSAFAGAYLVSRIAGFEHWLKEILGAVLLLAAAAMLLKIVVDARRPAAEGVLVVRPLPTLLIGVAGGLVVGMTSVGSGSLMIVMLGLLYPSIPARVLVGTDLVQAIPLVGAAALGHLAFGQFSLHLTGSVLIGAIPGVIGGALLSARAGDRVLRPVLVVVLAASALKLLQVSNGALLIGIGAAGVAAVTLFGAARRRARLAGG